MKRNLICVIAALSVFLANAFFLEAESLDKTVATVRLAKTQETIFASQLKKSIDATEQLLNKGQTLSKENKQSILDEMIMKILIVQAAERDKLTVTNEMLKTAVDNWKKMTAQQMGWNRDFTDLEWQNLVKSQTGQTYDEWLEQFKDTVIIPQQYVYQKRGTQITGLAAPTDAEVQEAYDATRSLYIWHDMASISYIVKDTSTLTTKEDRDKALRLAEDIAQELRAGAAFKDLVLKYSDDTLNKYKEGKMAGWVDRENAQYKQALGAEIFNAIFKMQPGDVSGVLAGPRGYYIIRVDARIAPKLLGLDDPLVPDNKATVREAIRANLLAQKQQAAFTAALKDLGDTLRKEAEDAQGLKVFQENLPW